MAANSDLPVITSREYAEAQDEADPLAHVKHEFRIPTKMDLRSKTLPEAISTASSHDSCIYLCGNSLGLQPKRTPERIQQYLSTWATQGVFGHFKPLEHSPLPAWLDADDEAARRMAPIVGAKQSEVAVMETLTANLHLLMATFYRPDSTRHKIILESKAFPSDHYAVESQILSHGLSTAQSMVTIEPQSASSPLLTTEHIIRSITDNAATTALILLPGIQFYTGQLLDIPTITAHARSLSIPIIWDLAHAVGNVPLQLHSWDVDAAAWCSYKYLNGGPGTIGGLFLHERHSQAPSLSADSQPNPRGSTVQQQFQGLKGWWGSNKATRFQMTNSFEPSTGASTFQLSNPSIFDLTSLCASLEVFELAGGMEALHAKSLKLTAYLETLLLELMKQEGMSGRFSIITPQNASERGAQLSVRVEPDLLDAVVEELEGRGVVIDERRPDVVRVAPAPLYNGWVDVWEFQSAFAEAVKAAVEKEAKSADKAERADLVMTT